VYVHADTSDTPDFVDEALGASGMSATS
jgi:hypothetical protein